MAGDYLELQRFRGDEGLVETKETLEAAGIEFRLSSTNVNFDLASIGSGQDAEVIVTIHKDDYQAARAALEQANLSVKLPEGYHLLDATDDELAEILGHESDWSPFDVAHARRLAGERGVDMEKVIAERAAYLQKLQNGKPAPQILITAGWIFSVLGGVFGAGIAWSLMHSKDKTPHGEFFTYDKDSQKTGARMMCLAVSVLIIQLILLLDR